MRFLGFDREFYRSLLFLTLPAVLQFFLFHLLNLSDNWMVASLGTVALSGVALSNKITLIVGVLMFGVANGVAVYTAQVFSIKDYSSIHKAYAFLMTRAFVISLCFFVPAFFFAPFIMSIITSDPEIIQVGSIYLPVVAISYIPMSLSSALSWLMRSFKEAKVPLYATAFAVVLNLGLNYLLIFVLNWGVMGAAVGTVIARLVELLYLVYKAQGRELSHLIGLKAFLEGLHGSSRQFKRNLFKLVIPVASNELLWAVSIATLEFIYVGISRSQYAAYVISSGAAEFSYFVFHALAISCGIILGNHAKEGKEVLAKMGSGLVRLGFCFGLVNVILVFSLSFMIPSFFPHLEDNQMIGAFLRTIAFFTFFNLLSLMMNIAILRAGGDALFALLVDTIPQWTISIPLAFFLSVYYQVSVRDIYIVVACVEFCKFLIFYARVRSGRWIKNILSLDPKDKPVALH